MDTKFKYDNTIVHNIGFIETEAHRSMCEVYSVFDTMQNTKIQHIHQIYFQFIAKIMQLKQLKMKFLFLSQKVLQSDT